MESALRVAALVLLPFALPPSEPDTPADVPFERNLLGQVADRDGYVPFYECNFTDTDCVWSPIASCKLVYTIVEGEVHVDCFEVFN